MPLYKADPNDNTKQVPNIQGSNRSDSLLSPTAFSGSYKAPNFIVVVGDVSAGLGFWFDKTAFSASAAVEGPNDTIYSGSSGYDEFNTIKSGQYNISPIAVSGSAADVAKIKFVYKSGLATGGF